MKMEQKAAGVPFESGPVLADPGVQLVVLVRRAE